MGKKFYAVKVGKTPDIYKSWSDCQNQISGFSGGVILRYGGTEMQRSEKFVNNNLADMNNVAGEMLPSHCF